MCIIFDQRVCPIAIISPLIPIEFHFRKLCRLSEKERNHNGKNNQKRKRKNFFYSCSRYSFVFFFSSFSFFTLLSSFQERMRKRKKGRENERKWPGIKPIGIVKRMKQQEKKNKWQMPTRKCATNPRRNSKSIDYLCTVCS